MTKKQDDKNKRDVLAATLTIHYAHDMGHNAVRAVSDWLRQQADSLSEDSMRYSNRYTAQYWLKKRTKSFWR